ncbi:MAG: enoyl-CoA hydratase/isomerase family protein [Proteobacteria bacterium]|nr:enoyl-CoA hydratase/isomerase family protein [Pseudomonadota bacterium]
MSNASSPTLAIADGVATLRFCRPEEHNRIDPDDLPILMRHFERVVGQPGVRVLVVTGSGEKTFSSGYTVHAIREHLDDRLEKLLDTLESLPLPVVCALNGSAYGGAVDLALCCDFRIGVRGSRMFMPAAKFGLHYYPGGLRRYVTRLGLNAAKKLFLTAQTVGDEEMLRIGFLTELVDRAQFDATVQAYVKAILECEPNVVASMKKFLNQTADGAIDVAAQRAAFTQSLRSDELASRLGALAKP